MITVKLEWTEAARNHVLFHSLEPETIQIEQEWLRITADHACYRLAPVLGAMVVINRSAIRRIEVYAS